MAKTCDAIHHGSRAVHDFRCIKDGVAAFEGGERLVIGIPVSVKVVAA